MDDYKADPGGQTRGERIRLTETKKVDMAMNHNIITLSTWAFQCEGHLGSLVF